MSKMKPKLTARQAAYKIFEICRSNRLDMIGIMFDERANEGGMVNHVPDPKNIAPTFVRFIATFEKELIKRLDIREENAKEYIMTMVSIALSDEAQQKTKVEHIVDPEPLAE